MNAGHAGIDQMRFLGHHEAMLCFEKVAVKARRHPCTWWVRIFDVLTSHDLPAPQESASSYAS